MRFERTDLALFIIATLLALMGFLQENTFLSVASITAAVAASCYSIFTSANGNRLIRSISCAIAILLGFKLSTFIAGQNFEKEMRRNYGTIYPANENVSVSTCDRPGAMLFYASTNNVIVNQFPFTFLNIDGEPILVLDRGENNALIIKYLLLNDLTNENLATISDNEFWINPNVRRFMIPSRSRLAIANHSGSVALNIASLNKNQLSVQGEFYFHKFRVVLGKNGVEAFLPTGKKLIGLTNNCFYQHTINVTSEGLKMVSNIPGAVTLSVEP